MYPTFQNKEPLHLSCLHFVTFITIITGILHHITEKKAFVYRSRHQQSGWLWPNTAARGCLSWLFRDGQVSYRSWCQCSPDHCGWGPDSATLCGKEWSRSVCEDSAGLWCWHRCQRLQTSKSFTGWFSFLEYILLKKTCSFNCHFLSLKQGRTKINHWEWRAALLGGSGEQNYF